MKRSRRVTLSRFSFEALARGESPRSDLVQARIVGAIRLYLHEAGRGRPGWSVPTALRGDERAEVDLDLAIDEDLLRALEAEAEKQDVTVSRLVSQAAIYYAAELDSGRIAQRVLEDLEGGP